MGYQHQLVVRCQSESTISEDNRTGFNITIFFY